MPVVVAVNRFPTDSEVELAAVVQAAESLGAPASISAVHADGAEGGRDLAARVVELAEDGGGAFAPLYDADLPLTEKIDVIAREIYGADGVDYADGARRKAARLDKGVARGLPVCMAKTQYSLSDDPSLLGRPRGFRITVRDLRVSAGAGFVVPITGSILTMPGLPRRPFAEEMDIDGEGRITGLA